jgi:hypothetical protein
MVEMVEAPPVGEASLAGIADVIKLIEKLDREAVSPEYKLALADLRVASATE